MATKDLPIVKLGQLLPKPYKNGIYKSSESYGQGTPILRITDFDNDGNLTEKKLQKVNLTTKEIESYQLKNSDIIVNRVNSLSHLGKSILWKGSSTPSVYESNMMRIEPNESAILPGYLARVLQTHQARVHFCKVAKRAVAQCSINQQDVKSLQFPLPPLPEQKKIAQILSTWDKAIDTSEKLLANSRQQKKALMQQLLTGKKRLRDKNGVRFSEHWETYQLGHLFSERVETGRKDLPLLSITSDDGVVYQEDTGRKNTSNEDKSKYRRININDIGYNTMRMWQGRSSLSDKEGIVSPAYTILIPGERVVPAYAAQLFKLPQLIHVFYRHSQGLVSDTWNLKFNHFKKISWQFPSLEEQYRISGTLSSADQEIETLQQKLDCLKQEKKALMQQLLTGKRRVQIEEAQ
ncbi:restriction endonuclease subunit S [Microbulbifer sp. DLAB2-AF]|uniref:restriction endonuclease subunit S n=1 Tax=Microbulbifer sp. DLAB2-AF TaxID=3243395 RepID=UPI004039F415